MTIFFGVFNDLAMQHITSTEISIFHTIFNVTVTIMLFPFANALVKLSGMIIREDEIEEEEDEEIEEMVLRHLDPRILETPSFAVENAVKEVARMGNIVIGNLNRIIKEAGKPEPSKKQIEKVFQNEKVINHLDTMITEYLVKISKLSISEKQMEVVNYLFDTITDIERAGDHVENIAEGMLNLKQTGVRMVASAKRELKEMTECVRDALDESIQAMENDDVDIAKEAIQKERKVDKLEKQIRKNHIERLKRGYCVPEEGVFFLDIVSNLERISDHADNIANYVLVENDENIL